MRVDSVITEHAQRAAFAWSNRSEAVARPDYRLPDLRVLDDCIAENLNALAVAGADISDLIPELLSEGEDGAVFVATAAALQLGHDDLLDTIPDAVGDMATAKQVAGAIAWTNNAAANDFAMTLLATDNPFHLHAGIASVAVRHLMLPEKIIARPEVVLHPRMMQAIGELGLTDMAHLCRAALSSDVAGCRYFAARSCLICGDRSSRDLLQAIVTENSDFSERAWEPAFRGLTYAQAASRLQALAAVPECGRLAVLAAGAIGDPVALPWVLDQMATDELAKVAGATFAMITGVDLEFEDLTTGLNDEEVSEDVAPEADLDDAWPEPDGSRVRAWWEQNQGRFPAGQRFLAGLEITEENLWTVLEQGTQTYRAAAAWELALLQPGRPLFNVKAKAERQLRLVRTRRRH